jgi:hypothetical protein
MNVDKKVQELLSKGYKMDYWDCYNDEPNTDEWMFEQQIENSLIVVEEVLNFLINDLKWDVETNGNIHFWQEVKDRLIKMKEDVDK